MRSDRERKCVWRETEKDSDRLGCGLGLRLDYYQAFPLLTFCHFNIFGEDIGQLNTDHLNNKIKEGVFLSSKSYSYICENDIPGNENKLKNNIIHTKGISDSFSKQYIDHLFFKETLINNNKPEKISFNTIQIKKQKISTKQITKNNIEFLNDKRYIKDVNSNIPHTLYIE